MECGKAYGQKGELIKHNQRVHGDTTQGHIVSGETNWAIKSTATILTQAKKKKVARKQEYYYQ